MKPIFYKTLVLIVLLGIGIKSHAERGDTLINPYFELMRLTEHFRNDSLYTMNAYQIYDYTDSSSNHRYDTIHIVYTISGDKYQVITDTTEEVQSDLYNIKVNNVDSFMVVTTPRQVFPMVIQADMTDINFRKYQTNINVVDSGVLRNILVAFKLSSPYYSYLLAYDSAMDFVAVKYKMRNRIPQTPSGSYTITEPSIDYTALQMSVYITMPSPRPPGLFDTDKYFTRLGKTLIPKAPYANYTVINLLSNQ